jgi:hypothetical protein
MGRYVPIRFNDDEAARLERSFAASGEEAISTHIKHVYFDAMELNAEVLQNLRMDLNDIRLGIDRLSEQRGGGGQGESDLLLTILSGMYLMVRKSVGDSVRAQADQALDPAAIESLLRGR